MATGTWQATDVKIWNSRNGTLLRNFPVDRSATVCFSPDGRRFVAATNEAYRLWQTASWHSSEWISLDDAGGTAAITCFTRDGRMLAVGSRYQVRLIDPDRMRQLALLKAPDLRPLKWLCFSRDGTRLGVATENHRIQLWDLRLIREQLVAMNLDWDLPPYPARQSEPDVKVLKAEVFLGDLGKAASGVARRP